MNIPNHQKRNNNNNSLLSRCVKQISTTISIRELWQKTPLRVYLKMTSGAVIIILLILIFGVGIDLVVGNKKQHNNNAHSNAARTPSTNPGTNSSFVAIIIKDVSITNYYQYILSWDVENSFTFPINIHDFISDQDYPKVLFPLEEAINIEALNINNNHISIIGISLGQFSQSYRTQEGDSIIQTQIYKYDFVYGFGGNNNNQNIYINNFWFAGTHYQ